MLEGLDGSGKTTIALRLCKDLEGAGLCAVYTYEPYDTKLVHALRNEYAGLRDAYVDALTYAADRLLHYKMAVKPYVERGCFVVSDRYYMSSVAYQGAMGAPIEWLLEVNRYAPRPDIAIYLDVEPARGLERKLALGSRFPEYERIDLLVRARAIYLELVRRGYMILVDSNGPLEQAYMAVKKLVLEQAFKGLEGRRPPL